MARANAQYYATHDPFADFTTAPEISQVFGELIGLWAGVVWRSMGAPAPVILAEAGPGRGTLMADARRAIAQTMPDFAAALRLHLVETSPALRAAQARRLPDATWHDRLDTLPDGPLLFIANEFFDALPIRQFVRRGAGWAERFVHDGAFIERPATFAGLDAPEGAVVECGEAAIAIVTRLAARLAAQGGAALIVDYGPARSAPGDSLQALYQGEPADPLAAPGEADLTAHVDFAALARAARAAGAAVHGPEPQGKFLAELGLFQRTGRIARTQPPSRAGALIEAAQRLAEPERMGRLFKALAVCHPDLPLPPGFPA
ncbi:MAG: SAM-dependent methyltransferase [Rhodospirillales bacterium]|nr:SAM-dependent methyltransferase [Rhodospirillales bacterium]MDE2573827.1 SAM-dependent methyltransferase [Rhodospirillales bacterium]